jgi:hypothetical protein
VDEDLGHTLVHYLYTGTYQTLKLQDASGDRMSKRIIEYKRNVQLYWVARTYSLCNLELLTKINIENLGEEIPIFDILDVSEEAYRKFSSDETWYTEYLKRVIKKAFEADKTLFIQQRFLAHIGRVGEFDKALVRIILEIYTTGITNNPKIDEALREETPTKRLPTKPLRTEEQAFLGNVPKKYNIITEEPLAVVSAEASGDFSQTSPLIHEIPTIGHEVCPVKGASRPAEPFGGLLTARPTTGDAALALAALPKPANRRLAVPLLLLGVLLLLLFLRQMPVHKRRRGHKQRLDADNLSNYYIRKFCKRCPNTRCGVAMEKYGGCDHVTCPFPFPIMVCQKEKTVCGLQMFTLLAYRCDVSA